MKTKFWILIICVVAILCVTLPGSFADPDVAKETSAATEATDTVAETTDTVFGISDSTTKETTVSDDSGLIFDGDIDGAAAISLEEEQEALELFARLISCQSREELDAVLNTTTSEKTEIMFECLNAEERKQFVDLICTYMPETVVVESAGEYGVSDGQENQEQGEVDYEIKPFTNVAPFVKNGED